MSKTLTILGAGESGIGAAILGQKHGYKLFLSDAGSIGADRIAVLNTYGVEYEEGGHSEERILASDLVMKSPGIPDKAPLIKKLLAQGTPVISEIEFAYMHIHEGAKILAITGTNGKTTTTLLTYHLLKNAGFKVALGGNVGFSLAKLVAEGGYDYYVIEISSFQLDGIIDFKPDVAVLLNITPDHLDRYEYSFEKYAASKFRIAQNMNADTAFIYCGDSEPVVAGVAAHRVQSQLLSVSTTKSDSNAHLNENELVFDFKLNGSNHQFSIPIADLSLIGKHNMINSMSAVTAAVSVDVPLDKIREGLKSFINAPHRLEVCGDINDVRFINDSKATNVDSVYYALEGINQPIVWIAGGTDKGNDYSQIAELVQDKVKALICLGVDNTKLHSFFGDKLEIIKDTKSAAQAVSMGLELASPGDVVLLSPACASFDLFKNYEDRGDQFRAAVKEMVQQKAAEV